MFKRHGKQMKEHTYEKFVFILWGIVLVFDFFFNPLIIKVESFVQT